MKEYNPNAIANEFARFYSRLGPDLAAKISPGRTSVNDYLAHIKRTDASLVLRPIPQSEIESVIHDLPNKSSYGSDGIINILLKSLASSISFPLCALFNQSLAEGKFPVLMKSAEVIPLYKGKEFDLVVNYRPVSLLLTISKVLEKAVYSQVYKFLENHQVLYDSQYGFRSKRSCEQAILELTGRVLHMRNNSMHSAALFLDLKHLIH